MELGLSILPVKIYLVVYNPADSAAHVSLADSSSDVEEEDALPPRTLPTHLDISPANAEACRVSHLPVHRSIANASTLIVRRCA